MPDTHDTHGKQPKTAAKPRREAVPEEVLRARPVKGNIDYAKLSREHIARFPKIMAALARAERR